MDRSQAAAAKSLLKITAVITKYFEEPRPNLNPESPDSSMKTSTNPDYRRGRGAARAGVAGVKARTSRRMLP
jgi:hypothetical protein